MCLLFLDVHAQTVMVGSFEISLLLPCFNIWFSMMFTVNTMINFKTGSDNILSRNILIQRNNSTKVAGEKD